MFGLRKSKLVPFSLFSGASATYTRLVPNIKKRYDYAAMVFLLTFNLVAVSGLRAEKVMELARDRLSTIAMGFAICITTCLLVCPVWAGDELHYSMSSNFENLALSIEGMVSSLSLLNIRTSFPRRKMELDNF